ncbi:MAG: hypothetical protein ABL977_01955 [Candidatus Eisenbacteria bacterium]
MKSPRTLVASAPVAAAAILLALGLGACSRTQNVTSPSSSTVKAFPGTRDVPVSCPSMIPNTLETAVEFQAVSGMCASFTPRRVRFEITGDLPSPSIENMGPCVAVDAPSIRFMGGHANVFIHGTTTSITETGQQLTFGELLFPGRLVEPGVVVASDAGGNVLEVIWPSIAGVGVGQPIIRVQLSRWNTALLSSAQTYDIVWDMVAVRDSVPMYFKGSAERINLSGSATPQAFAGAPPACPQTLMGTSDSVVVQMAAIVQYRLGRLRLEALGDVPSGTLHAAGLCVASEAPTIQFLGGSANMWRSGTALSVTETGQDLLFGPLVFPGVFLEPGVVVASDAGRNVLEIIWPGLAGLGEGPPILRLQLERWNSWVTTGREVDARMTFTAVGPDGITGTYTANIRKVMVPAQK